tara:strand:- start:551 stop:937 length:387 start_codon:yes stop_codon:yes gene_type:complete
MFDRYLIVDDSLRNVGPESAPSGFAFDAKLGYYRGLGLSMVEALDITVDGEPVPREAVRFDESNGPLSLDEMETAFDRRWPFGASATITVEQSGGLAPGEHRLEFSQRLRVSYMPFPSINSDAKTLTI